MKKGRRVLAMVLAFCLILNVSAVFAQGGLVQSQVLKEKAMNDTGAYILKTFPEPIMEDSWYILALSRAGYSVPDGYYDKFYNNVVSYLQENDGVVSKNNSTEYSKLILALTSIGKDVTNVGGYNLLESLADYNFVKKVGLMGSVWALIALDSYDYAIPQVQDVEIQTTKDLLLENILGRELLGGGFDLANRTADIDVTAMVVQSLIPYQDNQNVKAVIDRALTVLSGNQKENGGYIYYGVENIESSIQVLVALSALGIDVNEDSRFIKADASGNNHSVFTASLEYFVEGGGFEHILGGGIDLAYATFQGMYGLAAYERFLNNQNSLYDMTDVKGISYKASQETNLVEKENEESGLSFNDISSHWAKEQIEASKGLGITNGKANFKPDNAITRAEFAVAMVNALGLTIDENNLVSFEDVNSGAWYNKAVLIAASNGIISGNGDGTFSPDANIERQAAMAIIKKVAELYNMESAKADEIALNNFTDTNKIATWAKDAVLFNVNNGIIVGSNGNIAPVDNITRAESIIIVNKLLEKLSLTSQYK